VTVPWFYRTQDPSETDVRLHRDTSLARHSDPQSPLVIPNHRVVRNLNFLRGETASLNEHRRLAVTTHQSLRGLKARSNLVVETASQARLRARSDTLLLGQKARLLRKRKDDLAVTREKDEKTRLAVALLIGHSEPFLLQSFRAA